MNAMLGVGCGGLSGGDGRVAVRAVIRSKWMCLVGRFSNTVVCKIVYAP